MECGRGVPMEVGEVADGRAVKRGRVLADPPEEMELRGEGWRRDEAARGRGVGSATAYSIAAASRRDPRDLRSCTLSLTVTLALSEAGCADAREGLL